MRTTQKAHRSLHSHQVHRGRKIDFTPDPNPVPPSQERKKLPFLKAFVKLRVIYLAAKAVGIDRNTVNAWRAVDPKFARAFEQCEETLTEELEAAAHKRSLKKSDGLMQFLLRARNRKKYGDHVDVALQGAFTLRDFYAYSKEREAADPEGDTTPHRKAA